MKHDADLESLLGYQLQVAFLQMTAHARKGLEPYDLTPAKVTALLLIRANPGCDQTALGRALNINRSSAMKLVNVLAAQELIERQPGRNLRTNALHLLPEGARRLDDVLAALRDSDREMSGRLSEVECATLFALLRKLGPGRIRSAGSGAQRLP